MSDERGGAMPNIPVQPATRVAPEDSLVRLRQVIGAGAVAVLAAACSLGDPADAGSVIVDIETDRGTLAFDEIMSITVTARNVGYDPYTLTGPSDCLLYMEVLDTSGQVVWHSNGACTGGTVTESVAPGGNKVQTFTWDGTNLAGARLASGYYLIRGVARVTGAAFLGPARSVALE